MPYPEPLVQPMRGELTRLGVEELRTVDAVDAAFEQAQDDEKGYAVSAEGRSRFSLL